MSSSERRLPALFRSGLLAATLAAAVVLSACTLTPVYSEATQARLHLTYGTPKDHLTELVYQDLAARFPPEEGPSTYFVNVTGLATKASSLTKSDTNNPLVNRIMTATATVRIIDEGGDGKTLLSVSRTASASYQTNGQILADRASVRAAEEQAVHALAETIRLTILATLAQ